MSDKTTVIKYIQAFRSLIYPGIKAGVIKQNPFLDKMKPKPVYKEILSQEEVNQLSEVNCLLYRSCLLRYQATQERKYCHG